jgi:GGDEF domain-containing protein
VQVAPQVRLYRILWGGALAALLFSLTGALLLSPPNYGLLFLQTLLFFAWAFGCSRFAARAPDHATGAFLSGGLLIMLACTRASVPGWAMHDLAGVAYLVVAIPAVLGVAIAWGWAGVMLNAALTLLVAVLTFEVSVPQGIVAVFTLLANTVGGLFVHLYFLELEALQRRLERSASTDLLTRTGNRRALLEDYGRYQAVARRQGVPLLVMSWDVDGLKRLNDREGHAAGDRYIMAFVEALREAVRQGDSLYRVGGDEFVTLHLGLSSGSTIYERVRLTFPHVSGGWTRGTNLSLDAALTEADEMMYAEKRMHKARITRVLGDTAASRG